MVQTMIEGRARLTSQPLTSRMSEAGLSTSLLLHFFRHNRPLLRTHPAALLHPGPLKETIESIREREDYQGHAKPEETIDDPITPILYMRQHQCHKGIDDRQVPDV